MSGGISDAEVGRVLTFLRASDLAPRTAEDLAVEVVRDFCRGVGPPWLVRAAPWKRLDVLAALAVLRVRSRPR